MKNDGENFGGILFRAESLDNISNLPHNERIELLHAQTLSSELETAIVENSNSFQKAYGMSELRWSFIVFEVSVRLSYSLSFKRERYQDARVLLRVENCMLEKLQVTTCKFSKFTTCKFSKIGNLLCGRGGTFS